MTIITAIVSPVKFGTIEIEGLMFSDGSYAIALQQVASLFQVIPTTAPKWLKAILGADASLFSVTTNREQVEGRRVRSKESALTLIQFERVLRVMDRKGNLTAQSMTDALVGLSLTQLFSDSFGVKFEADDRQKYLETRMAGKVTRRTLTDSIDSYVQTHAVSVNYGHWIYSNVSDCLNLGLFGKKASKLCIERGCNKNELRDTHDEVTLARIDKIEAVAMIQIDNGMEPIKAMKFTLSTVFRIAC